MSPGDVEVVRNAYEAYNRNGSEGTLEFLHEDVVWDESTLPARRPGVYRGHEGVLELGRENAELWKEIKVDVEELLDAGPGKVVASVRVRGHGRHTGQEVELAMSQVWWIRDGKGYEVRLFLDRQEALEAAGAK